MFGPLSAGRTQSVVDRQLDIDIIDVERDLAQIVEAHRLRHLGSEAELLQHAIGPSKQPLFEFGFGVRVRFGVRLRERDEVRHHFGDFDSTSEATLVADLIL